MGFTKKVLLLALGLSSLHTALAQTTEEPALPEPTLASVEASVDEYLALIQNGTVAPPPVEGNEKRFIKLPTGCELAVSLPE